MNQPNTPNPAPLDEVYQQLTDAGSIQRPHFLKIFGNDMAAAKSTYDHLLEASVVSPVGETHEIGEIPPVLTLTEFGMTFLVSRGYTLRQ